MEDSGYFSHRSNEFKFSSTEGDSGRIPSPEDLFRLKFDDLEFSPFSYLRHGFADAEDFEDFKRELQEFRRLRRGLRGETLSPGDVTRGGRTRGRCEAVRDSAPRAQRRWTKGTGEREREGGQSDGTGGERIEQQGLVGGGGGGGGGGGKRRENPGDADQPPSPPPPHPTPLLKRGVSLRVKGGGPRARASKKRNGVYFDDGCFPSEPATPYNHGLRGSRDHHAACDTGNDSATIGWVSGPVSSDTAHTQWPRSVPTERTPAGLSGRKKDGDHHSTRDTFTSGELSPPRQGTVAHIQLHESEPQRESCAAEIKRYATPEVCNGEQDQVFVKAGGTRPTKDSCCWSEKNDSDDPVDANRPLQNHERLTRTERSARAACLPVSHQNGHADIPDDSDRLVVGNRTAVCEKLTSGETETTRVNSHKNPAAHCDKERVHGEKLVREKPPIKTNKNDSANNRDNGKTDLHLDEHKCTADPAIPERHTPPSQRRSWRQSDPKRSSLLLLNLKRLSRCGRPPSGRDLEAFMEFFNGDEHFQEFERVFETINNNRRLSRDAAVLPWVAGRGEWRGEESSGEEEDDHLGVLYIDETFMDFFDNDEDFLEFERELERVRSNRRSRLLLESLSRRSSCDIFSDVESFCERNLGRKRGSTSTSSTSPKVERRLSATSSADCDLWNSAEEWNMVMKKLRRNSRLFSEQAAAAVNGSCCCVRTGCVESSPSADGGGDGGGGGGGVVGRMQALEGVAEGGRHFDNCPCVRDCQYTCHSNCVPSVTLDCTTVSPGSSEGPVATPSDLPSPSGGSVETSLSERQTLVAYRSPQKQPQGTPERSASQNVQCLTPPGGAKRVATPPRDVSSSSERDPLLGKCVSQTSVSGKALSSSSSVCVASDSNPSAGDNVAGGGVQLEGSRVREVISDAANEKDETDSGYRSGTIPDENLPKAPSQATLDRKELRRKVETFNHFVPKASLEVAEDGVTFQGFLRVTLNLVRPITMELGARPPSIYELLTREHIVEQSTLHVAFYMPRDTVKSIHITSKTTTREVITSLLKKFHIVDNPRKFAMYEQVFNEKNKLVKLRRLTDKDFPLLALLSWKPDNIKHYRLVLQENETGEIVWDAFSTPELKNFMVVLDREESEAISQLQYKYRVMKRIILQRMKELRQDKASKNESSA
ncbi:uncharacterized protein LOC143299947 [Babylonia areolata]|uniref:uncharacterized protein LOC143299947 n=1 Tax=Babylonia areolata TaxID=304850 RepID=UPI003FD42EA7